MVNEPTEEVTADATTPVAVIRNRYVRPRNDRPTGIRDRAVNAVLHLGIQSGTREEHGNANH